MEWSLLDKDYDFKNEIRTSGYADMLNDYDRNLKYFNALKDVILRLKREKVSIHVLDIGCGSGILSMMALKLGADKVTACESFEPMYECAKNVLKKNNMFSDKIDLICCNSSELVIGVNMKKKANILVSEIFDTELIGEGVLPTFYHAIKNLLTDDAIVIPFKAQVYLQVLDSEFLYRHSWLKESKYFSKLPSSYHDCQGYSSIFDIQASLLTNYHMKTIGEPILVKTINLSEAHNSFSDKIPYSVTNLSEKNTFSVVIWWELSMTNNTDDCISTAPKWIYGNKNGISNGYHWRDHWLQGVFSFRKINPTLLSQIDFNFNHDTFSFWIDSNCNSVEKNFCTCGLHLHIPRNRLYELNSSEYTNRVDYITKFALLKHIKKAIVISDFSYLVVSLAQAGVSIYNIIDNTFVRLLMQELITLNLKDTSQVKLLSLEDFSDNCSDVGIFADPFFIYSTFPWDNIHFWYAAEIIRRQVSSVSVIMPQKMCIKALMVKFDHLHKINKRVKHIEGFNMSPFDDIIHGTGTNEQLAFESKFLWEYDSYSRSEVCDLLTIDMTASIEDMIMNNNTELVGSYSFKSVDFSDTNGLVLWTTWELHDNMWLDTSLESINHLNNKIIWKPMTKQAVHFLGDFPKENLRQLKVKCVCDVRQTNFSFSIQI